MTCTTCNSAANSPRVRILDGKIVEGCVDASHADHAKSQATSNYSAWFAAYWGSYKPRPFSRPFPFALRASGSTQAR